MLHSSRAFGFQRGWHSLCSWVGLASSSRDHHCRPAPTKTPGTRWELVDLSTSPRSAADNRKLCDNSKQHTPAVFLLTDTFLFVSLSFMAVQPPKLLLHLSPSLCRLVDQIHRGTLALAQANLVRQVGQLSRRISHCAIQSAWKRWLHLFNSTTVAPASQSCWQMTQRLLSDFTNQTLLETNPIGGI